MNPVRKRRKPANSKKGTTAKCKAPDKNSSSGICDKPFIVNKDRLKDHKYCSNACKSRASYYNKKKKQTKLKRDMKKLGVGNEVDLMKIKDRLQELDNINRELDIMRGMSFFSDTDMQTKIVTETLLDLCARCKGESLGDKFKMALNATKKRALKRKSIDSYLKEKEKQERKGHDLAWSMTINLIPNYCPIYFIELLK